MCCLMHYRRRRVRDEMILCRGLRPQHVSCWMVANAVEGKYSRKMTESFTLSRSWRKVRSCATSSQHFETRISMSVIPLHLLHQQWRRRRTKSKLLQQNMVESQSSDHLLYPSWHPSISPSSHLVPVMIPPRPGVSQTPILRLKPEDADGRSPHHF